MPTTSPCPSVQAKEVHSIDSQSNTPVNNHEETNFGSGFDPSHRMWDCAEIAKRIYAHPTGRNADESDETIPFWRIITDQSVLTPQIENYRYPGDGTTYNPFEVGWMDDYDPRNPMDFSVRMKITISLISAVSVLAVSFASSAFIGASMTIVPEFGLSIEVFTLGISLFVLGFALGPLLWAPLSELYGRQITFIITFAAFTLFNCLVPLSHNITTVLVLRFFAASFGSSPLTNAAGVISDVFPAKHRGRAMAAFALAPFLGPVIGPIAGNYLGEHASWRWVMGMMAVFSGLMWIMGSLFVPETYAPYLLRRRAEALSRKTGLVYRSTLDLASDTSKDTVFTVIRAALVRPWQLLFYEPIVLILSVYLAIIYGTLYMLFGAFPIVYMRARHWTPGKSSLPFLAVLVGMTLATLVAVFFGNTLYLRACKKYPGRAPPEARLTPLVIGSLILPIGLFWFAWTNGPTTHWAFSVVAAAPFGFGMIMAFLATLNYLIDAYTLYAASVMAASSVLRSLFGAAFPLFAPKMYASLGLHWASSVPAFMALACVPFPFIFLKYGPRIREKCKYAALSQAYVESMERRRGREETR